MVLGESEPRNEAQQDESGASEGIIAQAAQRSEGKRPPVLFRLPAHHCYE